MRCPGCEQKIHRAATECPHCGYSLADSDDVFGGLGLKMRTGRLADGAGLLRRAERKRVEREIRRFGRRFPQLFFAVRTVSLEEPVDLRLFGFWLLNRAEFEDLDEGMGNDAGVLLVIDAESRAASITWGYRVDPIFDERNTFRILSKAHPFFLEGDWCRGTIMVSRRVDKILRRCWWGALMGRGFGVGRGVRRPRSAANRIQFGTDADGGGHEVKA